MIIIIGAIRYTLKIVVFHSPNFSFPFDFILLFFLAVIAFFEALLYVYIKLVVEFTLKMNIMKIVIKIKYFIIIKISKYKKNYLLEKIFIKSK